MSFVAAIGPIVKNRRPYDIPAVKCSHCGTIQTKYVNSRMHKRRTCRNCKVTAIWYVGYNMAEVSQ